MKRNPLSIGLLTFSLLAFLCPACLKFDNPVELETGDGETGGSVEVTAAGLDAAATVLVVELLWSETGGKGAYTLRKTVPLDAAHHFTELTFTFDGLGQGAGHARAGTFIGTLPWQDWAESSNIQLLSENGRVSVRMALNAPSGDIDYDFAETPDSPGDKEASGDGDLPEGAESTEDDGLEQSDQADGADKEREYADIDILDRRHFSVPYSSQVPFIEGSMDIFSEWAKAASLQFDTQVVGKGTLYTQQNGIWLYLALDLPNEASPQDEQDWAGFAFDPDPATAGDEFVLKIEHHGGANLVCEPLLSATCKDLPHGEVAWTAAYGDAATGWKIEAAVKFAGIGLSKGVAHTPGFAALDHDNGKLSAWPPQADPGDSGTWGLLDSPDNWAVVSGGTDGDAELEEADPEETEFEPPEE